MIKAPRIARFVENMGKNPPETVQNNKKYIVLFWFLYSHGLVCSRSFYLLLNEKVFLIQYKCCIETRFSRCSSQEFAGFMVIVWFILLWICWHLAFNPSREIFQGDIFLVMLLLSSQDFTDHQEFFSLCCSYQANISQAIRRFFICEKFLRSCIYFSSCIYLSIYRSILRSCDPKFVSRFWAQRQHVAVVDVIVTGKRELPQVKSQLFVCGGLGNLRASIVAQRPMTFVFSGPSTLCK